MLTFFAAAQAGNVQVKSAALTQDGKLITVRAGRIEVTDTHQRLLWKAQYPAGDGAFTLATPNILIIVSNRFGPPMQGTLLAYQVKTGKLLWTQKYDSTLSLPRVSDEILVVSRFSQGESHAGLTQVVRLTDGQARRTLSGSLDQQNVTVFLLKQDVADPYDAAHLSYLRYDAQRDLLTPLAFVIPERAGCGKMSRPVAGGPVDPRTISMFERSNAQFIIANRVDRCGLFNVKFDWLHSAAPGTQLELQQSKPIAISERRVLNALALQD